jgi:hypothetical protein
VTAFTLEQFRTPRGRAASLYTRDETADHNNVYSCMTEDEYGLAGLTFADGDTALDIGAHIGGVSIGLALDNKNLHVVAVEALSANVEMLYRNIEANGVGDRVTVRHGAAERPGKKSATVRWNFEKSGRLYEDRLRRLRVRRAALTRGQGHRRDTGRVPRGLPRSLGPARSDAQRLPDQRHRCLRRLQGGATVNIVQWLAHSIEEYDQLRLLTEIGHTVFSPGAYIDPRNPADDKRPGLDIDTVPELKAAVDALGQPNHPRHGTCNGADAHHDTVEASKRDTPDAIIEWADVIIVHHLEHTWLIPQWHRIKGRCRVIWRTVGQSGDRNEMLMAPLHREGVEIVRYSPKERSLPGFAGEDALIRFYKDPADYGDWTGEAPLVTNITQSLYARSLANDGLLQPPGKQWTSYSFWEEATQGTAAPAGRARLGDARRRRRAELRRDAPAPAPLPRLHVHRHAARLVHARLHRGDDDRHPGRLHAAVRGSASCPTGKGCSRRTSWPCCTPTNRRRRRRSWPLCSWTRTTPRRSAWSSAPRRSTCSASTRSRRSGPSIWNASATAAFSRRRGRSRRRSWRSQTRSIQAASSGVGGMSPARIKRVGRLMPLSLQR